MWLQLNYFLLITIYQLTASFLPSFNIFFLLTNPKKKFQDTESNPVSKGPKEALETVRIKGLFT